MGPLLVSLMSLLVTADDGEACPVGCTCGSSSISCCKSDRYFQIPISVFDNATKLSLSGCPRLAIARQSFWTLKSLEDVTIQRTPITYIHPSAFADLPLLRNLALNELNLSVTNLHPSAFIDLPVHQLDLRNNNLQIIHSHMFSGMKNLQILDLSRNRISLIQHQAFESFILLSKLNLDYNNLKSVSPFWFNPSSNYSSLHISILGNNLTNECRFQGIDLPENHWFKHSVWPNDSMGESTINLPICSLPAFHSSYQEMYVEEQAPVTLPCSAIGTPRPTLAWLLPTGQEVIISTFSLTNGNLTIPEAKLGDSGIYACVATNSEGISVALRRLSVISNTMAVVTPEPMVTTVPKKKPSLVLIIIFIILLSLVLAFVLGYISRLIYKLAKKPDSDDFEFSRFVDTPNILPVPENPQPMPHL
ncbi:leucine-rich repeat and fibronectin type III domain-containing protein 1-like protein isoform X2 [Hyperolius riggenbachi]